ncbi:MAG: hypothetical protein BM562_05355 [Alphaproteobacteria bacterium MedPE-SWcel]|nr:MAG: hypothetical protein BM562_05355 [Alphaproteobacteria bacterium MedPE-SWcel]
MPEFGSFSPFVFEGAFGADSFIPPRSGGAWIQPLVTLGASNTAGGDDSVGAVLSAADDLETARWLNPATGEILPLDHTVGIPRPGGLTTQATTPAINLTRYLSDHNGGADIIYVIVPTAVGGRGMFGGGDVFGYGPWHPSGAGPAWEIGGTGPGTEVSGALYLAHTSGNWQRALNSAVAAAFPERTVLAPIFFGHPLNENDAGTLAGFHEFLSVTAACISGIRAAWGAPAAPWVLTGGPPEWTYSGALGRERVAAANAHLAQTLPNVAFVEGPEENQHPTEAIHFNNAGYRLLGTKCGPAVAVAQTREAAPERWTDWIDDLVNKPARYAGLYRGLSSYDGPALRISNGSTEIDVDYVGKIADPAAMLAHAGGGDAWIVGAYDNISAGMTFVPEGSGKAFIVRNGSLLFQGRRLAWGDDSNNIMLSDSSFALTAAGALLAVGRVNNSGTLVQAAGPQNTLGLVSSGGATAYARGTSDEFLLEPSQGYEPSFITALPGAAGGYTLHANYVDSGGMYGNGDPGTEGEVVGLSYGTAGVLSWGGRSGATNRYSVGSHVAIAAWSAAPTGDDKAAVLAWARAISAVDDV